jgi:hypothetical protein
MLHEQRLPKTILNIGVTEIQDSATADFKQEAEILSVIFLSL